MIVNDLKVSEEDMYTVYPRVKIPKRAVDLTNFVCHDITVLYKTLSEKIGKQKKAMWICKCNNCGNIIKRRGDFLYQKRIISCGCKNFPGPIDIKNKKFGKLTALNLSHYDKNNGYIWNCICECGNHCKISYCNIQKRFACDKCNKRKAMIELGRKGSKGSNKIKEILIKNNISFEVEWSYKDLYDKSYLYYDFFIPKLNLLIEYDGEQHFIEVKESSFMSKHPTKNHDVLKNNYARNNNINLIRIPYYDIDQISINDLLLDSKYLINKSI